MNITVPQIQDGESTDLVKAGYRDFLVNSKFHQTRLDVGPSQRANLVFPLGLTAIAVLIGYRPDFISALVNEAKTIWQHYLRILDDSPMVTKALTTGLLGAAGDIMAQQVEQLSAEESKATTISSNTHHEAKTRTDTWRALMNAVDGIFFTGPFMHYSYNWMERHMPTNTGSSPTVNALLQLTVDNIILDSAFIVWAIISSGILEGYSIRKDIIPQLRRDFQPAIAAGFLANVVIAPIEYACFRYMPLRFRVLAINFIDMVWDAVVSFMAHRSRK